MDSARLITRVVGWVGSKFYVLERSGGEFPDGPVLVVANHPNALLDPIVIFRVAGRVVRPLAKAPLFEHPVIGPVLRGLGGVPVYRKQDDPALMHENERMFDAAIAALHRGDAVQIYPEGQSHDEPRINPLKTGAARIAFQAEARADWRLGLRIVPIGLTFTRKTLFRGRALAVIGEPFAISDLRATYETDEYEAVRSLTARIASELESLTLNLERIEDVDLVDAAERLWAREKGLASWREREALGERLPRLQAFARGLAWLREHEPARHARLAGRVRPYRRQARLLGAGEADVPPLYHGASVARYIARQALVLSLGLPFVAIGLVFWYPPYLLVRLIIGRLKLGVQDLATYKLSLSIFAMPIFYVLWVALAFALLGPGPALLAAVALPPLGLLVHGWTGRWELVREDARLFLRVLGRPGRRDRLASLRKELVAEFDAVEATMSRATPARGQAVRRLLLPLVLGAAASAGCASGAPPRVSPEPATVPVPAVPAVARAGERSDSATTRAPGAVGVPAPFQSGVASWYGPGFDGRRTASGEIFRADSLTAAHPALPFGTRVRVVHVQTGREVIVRINDRGRFTGGRVIDLSRAAAEQLDIIIAGVADVVIYVINRAGGGGGTGPPFGG